MATGATVSWAVRDRAGQALFAGSANTGAIGKGAAKDVAIDLSGIGEPGLYEVDLSVSCEDGAFAYSYPTRFAILPPSGRAVTAEASPYATWWNSIKSLAHGCLPMMTPSTNFTANHRGIIGDRP